MPLLAPPPSSVVSQARGRQSVHARLLSIAPSFEVENGDDMETVDLRSLSSSTASSAAHSPLTCESCSQLETDFAAAVMFIESYQGPHHILTQAHSSPKKNLYAFYQQATVGPCPTATPSLRLSELELSKWEKWRNLGLMTKQEAMKRYTTVLDNLVDDWRRSVNMWSNSLRPSTDSIARQPSEADSATPDGRKWSVSIFECLPQIYGQLKELQDRMEEEAKKRDELETHLLRFTQDNRDMVNEPIGQTEQIRNRLENLEDNLVQHSTELQRLTLRQQQLITRAEKSVLVAMEDRVWYVFVIVKGWMQKRSVRTALVVLIGLRTWNFIWRHRLPQFLAQLLIRWLVKVSSLDGRNRLPLDVYPA